MTRIIFYALILCIGTIFQMNAEAYTPYISGPGIDPGSYVKVDEECTYIVKYTVGSGTSTTNYQVKWVFHVDDVQIIKYDRSKASITIKWKREGRQCNMRAYNIAIIDNNDKIASYTEASATIKVQSLSIGDIELTAPEKVLQNYNFNINYNIENTLSGLHVDLTGPDFVVSSHTNTVGNAGYFTGNFSSQGIKTLTLTVSKSGLTTKRATKTIVVYPNIITGENIITLNGQQTYKLVNAPAGTTYTWSIPSGLQIISGQGTSQVVVKQNGSYMGSGYIEVSFSGFTLKKNIAIGVPEASKIKAELGTNNTLYAYHTNRNESRASYTGIGTILEYEWSSTAWEAYNPMTSTKSIVYLKATVLPASSTANILVRARNAAGWSTWNLFGAQVNSSTSRQYDIQYSTDNLTISENTEEINTDINQSNLVRKNDPLVYELYNINNVSVAKKGKINRTGGTITINDLPKGFYIFSLIIDASTRQTMKIAIN